MPQLVPRTDLQPAIVLNGIGVNVSRAIGPALGGVMIEQERRKRVQNGLPLKANPWRPD